MTDAERNRPGGPDQPQPDGAVHQESRRQFLLWLIRGGTVAFAVAFLLPALALKTLTKQRHAVASGDELVYSTGNHAGQPIQASDVKPGEGLQAFPKGKSSDQENIIELVRLRDNQSLVAYSAICTHLGCTVFAPLNNQGYIHCPCHGSVFDPAHGAKVVSGPAPRPLPSIQIQTDSAGEIVVTGSFSGPIGPQ